MFYQTFLYILSLSDISESLSTFDNIDSKHRRVFNSGEPGIRLGGLWANCSNPWAMGPYMAVSEGFEPSRRLLATLQD